MIHEWEKNAIRVNTKSAFELNKWPHLFVTYDGSSKAKGVKIYIDGKPAELDDHARHASPTRSRTPVAGPHRQPQRQRLFRGRIDEVRIYRPRADARRGGAARRRPTRCARSWPSRRRSGRRSRRRRCAAIYLENDDEPYRKLSAELADCEEAQRGPGQRHPDLDGDAGDGEAARHLHAGPRPVRQEGREGDRPGTPGGRCRPLPDRTRPPNRLGASRSGWCARHPLTARVAVNRYWQMYFGTGLVKTAEDFGTQGERPSHPELLDWLATEFVGTGWDVKAMHAPASSPRATPIGTSRSRVDVRTYRQYSSSGLRRTAAGARPALPAARPSSSATRRSPSAGCWWTRSAGLPCKPYQPAGLWEEIAFGGGFTAQTYVQDHGEALYRRSMYTFWKRTCPPPVAADVRRARARVLHGPPLASRTRRSRRWC